VRNAGLAADLAEAFDAVATAEGQAALAVLDRWFHDVPPPPPATAAELTSAADPVRLLAVARTGGSLTAAGLRHEGWQPPSTTPQSRERAPRDPTASATRPDDAESLVNARRIRELRETTRQHGEQLVAIVKQLGALTEQVGHITARHTDLAAAVSEDLAPRVGALHQLVTEELGRLRSDLDVLLAERNERDKTKNPAVDWATLTEEQAAAQWPILARWVGEVLVPRYELTRDDLPDCWALHPPAVAELSWLHTAYVQAYLSRSPPQLSADWHTGWRPAVLTRIRELIKPDECSPGKHAPRRGRPIDLAAQNGVLPRMRTYSEVI
jgi:hypothetical protein